MSNINPLASNHCAAHARVDPRPPLGSHLAFSDGVARHVVGRATDFHFRSPQHIVSLAIRGHRDAELRLSSDRTRHYHVEPGTVHLIEAEVEIWKTWPGEYELSGFLLNTDAVERATQQPFRLRTALDLADPTISTILTLLHDELAADNFRGRLFVEGLSAALAAHLVAHHSLDGQKYDAHRGGLGPVRLRQFKEFVAAHFHDPDLSLDRIADAVGLSKSHLQTAVRQSLGKPPHRYVLEERLRCARSMLVATKLSVTEIAFRCGFASSSHFSNSFRRFHAVSPSSVRQASN